MVTTTDVKHDKKVLSLALDLLNGDPCALGNLLTQIEVTSREIAQAQIPNSHLSGRPLEVLHRKRIFATKKKARKHIVKIATENSFMKPGEKIPTTNYWLKSSSGDGFLLIENPERRTVDFFDPLDRTFIEFLLKEL